MLLTGINKVNSIHPSVIFDGDVELGTGNVIHPYSILIGPLVVGDNNVIGPHAVIGSPGQDTKNPRYNSSLKKIRIGSNNIIREFTSIHKSAYSELTSIGNNTFLMNNSHVSHDGIIENGVVLSMSSILAGLVAILENATLAMDVSVHQRCVVGQYAIAGQGASVIKNIKPFSRHIPKVPISVNTYALKKYQLMDLENEVSNYVLNDIMPTHPFLEKIVDRFQKLHTDSKKELYL